MIYNVTNDFTKINETSGTIQNTSRVFDLEVSNSPEPNSGFLLFGLNKFSFHNETIYLRCIGGVADVRVVPFSTSGGGNAASNIDDFNSQLDSILSGETFADDDDMQSAIDDIFNGSSTSSDPDIDSALDNIFNP